jgi:RNA polymerase primary sigma factor
MRTTGEPSTMGLYLRELRKIPQLSAEEELDCARLAARGNEASRQQLIQANLRFVIMVARRYRACGVPLEDLVNEGNIGLIQAAARFDPERGIRFPSYAVHWIRQAILKAIPDHDRMIRLPRRRAAELSRIENLRSDGLKASGREPRLSEIAESLVVDEGDLARLMQAAQRTVSLDSPAAGADDADSLSACLEDRLAAKPEEVLVDSSLKRDIDSSLAALSQREAGILQDRFGLAGREPVSLIAIGRKHGLSKERVRQIEKRALRKIRGSGCAEQLLAYAS